MGEAFQTTGARITIGQGDGDHLVEIEPKAKASVSVGPGAGARPLAYDVPEHVGERLWHVGGHLRIEPDCRRARRIVLATGIGLAQAAE